MKHVLTGPCGSEERVLCNFITSFPYLCRVPRDAGPIVDVRSLDEPQYAPDLRQLLPRYEMKAKTYLTFGIGRAGRRRGVVRVDARLTEQRQTPGLRAGLSHRDLPQFGRCGPVPSTAPTPAN